MNRYNIFLFNCLSLFACRLTEFAGHIFSASSSPIHYRLFCWIFLSASPRSMDMCAVCAVCAVCYSTYMCLCSGVHECFCCGSDFDVLLNRYSDYECIFIFIYGKILLKHTV